MKLVAEVLGLILANEMRRQRIFGFNRSRLRQTRDQAS